MAEEDCVFCKMVNGEIPVEKIYENENFFSFPDANPRIDGHSLVISKKHFTTTLDVPDSLGPELLDCIKKTAVKLMEKTGAGGFNVVNNNLPIGGQEVPHVHYHILPRKPKDGLNIFG